MWMTGFFRERIMVIIWNKLNFSVYWLNTYINTPLKIINVLVLSQNIWEHHKQYSNKDIIAIILNLTHIYI